MREIFVEKCKNNQSLCEYILNIFPNLSKSVLYKALRNKDIKVNEKRINKDISVIYQDKIELYIKDELLFNLPKKLDYIYVDNNIIVVFKPQGILSNNEAKTIDSRIGGYEPTLDDLVKEEYQDAIICHRLDRNTAGLVIFARNDLSNTEILKGFRNSRISKEYIAYVYGTEFLKDSDTLNNYLLKDSKNGFAKIYPNQVENSEKISTQYTVLNKNYNKDFSILKIKIHNGKTHQIRAQMANISHPIIGDSKYGKNTINKKFKVYKQLLFAVEYTFNFDEKSRLHYLNKLTIKLNESLYKKYIVGELK